MSKNQVRLQAANGTIVRLSEEEAARLGRGYSAVTGDLSKLKVAELKAYAEKHNIDLGDVTKKDEILAVIAESEKGDSDEE